MPINLKGRSLLTLLDFTQREIRYLLDLSHDLKAKRLAGIAGNILRNKNIVLLFEKESTRTRCSFEIAAVEEGGYATFIGATSSHFGVGESIEDSAKVLGRFYDGIEFRGYKQSVVESLAKYSGVPVWNGLTDVDHPTQTLADLMTVEEHVHKPLNKVKIVFIGDTANNMCHAWMYGCSKMGINFVGYGPKELRPTPDILSKVSKIAQDNGGSVQFTDNISGIKGADVISTDVWVSMGQAAQTAEKIKLLTPYRVTMDTLKATGNDDVIFMHCLPSLHNFDTLEAQQVQAKGMDIREVTDEVFNSKNSVVFDEAENRLHTIKAVLVATL